MGPVRRPREAAEPLVRGAEGLYRAAAPTASA